MNIFVLDTDPELAAEMMLDKHIVKMPTESMQMISTIMDLHGFDTPMKPVMLNHPCTIWARESADNFEWLVNHCYYLCKEYTVRYGKKHKIEEYLENYVDEIQQTKHELKLTEGDKLTPFAQAMPDKYKNDNVVKAYRDYYLGDKWKFASWKTKSPKWWPNDHIQIKKQEMVNKFNMQFNANIKVMGE